MISLYYTHKYSREVEKSNFRQYGQMEKQRWEESEKRREEERRSEQRKSQKKEDAVREKVAKSRFTVFFVAPEDQKVGSLKRRVWRHVARCEMKNCTPLWREAHVQVKMHKAHHARTTFGS